MILPVILSGGSGVRLWPWSRAAHPKQFLALTDDKTLLQNTALRLAGIGDAAAPLVVCNQEHRFMVAEQLRTADIRPEAILLEPVGRNTAPAVAVAALHARRDGADPLLLVLPSDHLIRDPAAFHAAVAQAAPSAQTGRLLTFGITPTAPETGYGYIQAGPPLDGANGVAPVARFTEKPDQATAQRYLESGEYFWNSGIFLFQASAILAELEHSAPEILAACQQALHDGRIERDFLWLDASSFARCPANSLDYAVMEKTAQAAVLPLTAGWSDVGSWAALWEVSPHDADGNCARGDVIAIATRNSYVDAATRLVATVGVENLVVVETADAVLVAQRDHGQAIKTVVERLQAGARPEGHQHRKVYRPWGYYDVIDCGHRFKVKRVMLKPGARISAQLHHHRAEHWVVVRGAAQVQRGAEEFLLTDNQSAYIPVGIRHCLSNPGKIPLEIIEVQSGDYLSEDDIIRFEDDYGDAQPNVCA